MRRGISENAAMTLSSLRLDELDPEYLALLKEAGYRTITLAPEAATERMRGVINKGISDGEIMESIRLIAEAGMRRVKLYFIIGLPGETDEDARAIVDLASKYKKRAQGRRGELERQPVHTKALHALPVASASKPST